MNGIFALWGAASAVKPHAAHIAVSAGVVALVAILRRFRIYRTHSKRVIQGGTFYETGTSPRFRISTGRQSGQLGSFVAGDQVTVHWLPSTSVQVWKSQV